MRINTNGKCLLLRDNAASEVVVKSGEVLRAVGFDDEYIAFFTDGLVGILDDYAELLGEGAEVGYSLKKRMVKIDIKLLISGESFDPFKNGKGAKKRQAEKIVDLNLNTELPSVSYSYAGEENRISIGVPLVEKHKSIFRDPNIAAILLGVIAGIICLYLPESINDFVISDIASPIQSTLLGVIAGIMGPFIFFSLATSIISMSSISELTNLGWKILKRFIGIILFIIVISLGVSAFFFKNFGTAIISFSPDQLIEMVLNIIPTNLFTPFVDNNTAQLVVLGILVGAILLILDDKVTGLCDMLRQGNKWIVTAMNAILKIVPAIPFLALMITIGTGNFKTILKGWKYILAVYIAYTIAVIIKAIKFSVKTGFPIFDFWKKIKPIVKTGFTTGSNAAPMKQIYDISDRELGIDPDFTSFWVPMCSSMMGVKTALYLVIAAMMTAEISGVAITNSFIFIMVLVTLELSLANPGVISAWTTMFEVLGLSNDYVGLFSTFRAFTENYCIAVTEAYDMMEQYEAAKKLGGMKSDQSG